MYKFAEAKTCRRQILLDALGGEKAVCSGCDICNGISVDFAQDEKNALHFIKKYNKFYNIEEMEQKLQELFNQKNSQNKKLRYWEIYDVRQIMKSLFEQGKIKVCKFPWKGKIRVNH